MNNGHLEYFLKCLSRRGMYVNAKSLESIFGFVLGFNAGSKAEITDGFREWLLKNYDQCNGPFAWPTFVCQILGEGRDREDAVDEFVDIIMRFIREKYGIDAR